jgi:20S proteasome subunit alpha 4
MELLFFRGVKLKYPLPNCKITSGLRANGNPALYLTDPAGTFSEWKANAIGGRNEKAVKEYLEKGWSEGLAEADAINLSIKALLEVVDSGAKNIEVAVIRKDGTVFISEERLTETIKQIETEKEEAKASATTVME